MSALEPADARAPAAARCRYAARAGPNGSDMPGGASGDRLAPAYIDASAVMTSRTMIRGFETSAISRSANAHAAACGDLMVVRGGGGGGGAQGPVACAHARGTIPAAAGTAVRPSRETPGYYAAPGHGEVGGAHTGSLAVNGEGHFGSCAGAAGPRAPARGAGECAAGRVGCRQRSAGPLAPATALTDAAVPTAGLYGGGGALGAHTTAALTVACRQAIGPPQICSNTISVRRIQ